MVSQERHTYDDPPGENDGLAARGVYQGPQKHTMQKKPVNASMTKFAGTAKGRMFLLVTVKSTNLGHKGDSDLYTIVTPDRSAFTLQYQGSDVCTS